MAKSKGKDCETEVQYDGLTRAAPLSTQTCMRPYRSLVTDLGQNRQGSRPSVMRSTMRGGKTLKNTVPNTRYIQSSLFCDTLFMHSLYCAQLIRILLSQQASRTCIRDILQHVTGKVRPTVVSLQSRDGNYEYALP